MFLLAVPSNAESTPFKASASTAFFKAMIRERNLTENVGALYIIVRQDGQQCENASPAFMPFFAMSSESAFGPSSREGTGSVATVHLLRSVSIFFNIFTLKIVSKHPPQ